MTNYKLKFVKSAAALALGASVITSAVVAGDVSASAKTTYKVSKGKLVNAKTKKAIKGYKSYKSVLYKDGKKFTGTYKGKYYKSGKLFTGTTSYGNYYKNGVKFTGKTSKGTYYKNGKKFNGTTSYGYYYINGKRAEGIVVVKGVDVLYKNGKPVADKTAPVITISGYKSGDKIELKNGAEFATPKASVKDNVDSKVKVVTEIKDQDGKVVDAIDTKVAGTYTITYAAKDASGNTSAATVTVVVGEGDLAVASVKAINLTSATINFNQAVSADSLDKADLTVTNKATGEKQVVKALTLSDDKKSAKVEFYSEVAANTTYTVSLKNGENTLTGDLVIGSLAPASVQLADQVVEAGKTIAYKVLDADGLDLTSLYPATSSQVTFETATSSITSDGVVNLAAGTSAKVKVVIKDATDASKVLAESAQVSVSVADHKLSSISAVTLADGTFDKPSTTVYGSTGTLSVQFNDQFDNKYTTADFATGKEFAGYTVSYESQNLGVAVVDKTTGDITALTNGTVPVKVTVKDATGKVVTTKTVEVTVKATKAVDTVSVDKTSLTLSKTAADSQTLKATVKDQYNNGFDSAPTADVLDADGKALADTITEPTVEVTPVADKTGEYTVTTSSTTSTTDGTYTVKLTAGSGAAAKTTTYKVVVKAAGSATQYVVKGLDSTFDIKNNTAVSITPSVYTADAEGLTVADVSSAATVAVSGNNNYEVSGNGDVVAKYGYTPKAGDKFTVTVKHGATTVAQQEITIVDTTAKYTSDFTAYTLSATAGNTLANKLESIVKVYIDGKEDTTKTYTVTGLTFVSTDSTVADNALETGQEYSVGKLAKGTATVLVNSITVNDGTAYKTIAFSTPVKFTVNVAE